MKKARVSRPVAMLAACGVLAATGCVTTTEDMRGEQVVEVRAPTNYLTCPAQALTTRADTQNVGPAGARLRVGDNSITIPANAIPEPQRIIFALGRADSVGVEVIPGRPVDFQGNRSAPIVVDLGHCGAAALEGQWWVWRINRQDINRSQKLLSTVAGGRAITHVDSLSTFMIAN
jgi:hypothetical protein